MDRRATLKLGVVGIASLAVPIPLTSFKSEIDMNDIKDYEVIIIGGSYAGLSAAMALGRSLRRVLIVDGGLPCNRQTPHAHNFITHDGRPPAEISAEAKK